MCQKIPVARTSFVKWSKSLTPSISYNCILDKNKEYLWKSWRGLLQKREPKEATSRQSSFTKPNSSHKSKGRRVHHKGKVTGYHIHILERQTLNTPQFFLFIKRWQKDPLILQSPIHYQASQTKCPNWKKPSRLGQKMNWKRPLTWKITVATNEW